MVPNRAKRYIFLSRTNFKKLLLTFDFLTFSGGIKMEHWPVMSKMLFLADLNFEHRDYYKRF